ncbi:hypothetical protein CBI36_03455 [Acetobacter oryzifermentans]|uniref:Uncharacterized protein n=2 Tax=Acetobacter TaxID=434 RepID=A0AAN1PIM1_9PROT|nr:hypothetical protein CBI36_03455 [Acetobacter oryzifermentans]AXN00978.1 hypothetical protein CJF59_10755 [Acetobacter pomorum]
MHSRKWRRQGNAAERLRQRGWLSYSGATDRKGDRASARLLHRFRAEWPMPARFALFWRKVMPAGKE